MDNTVLLHLSLISGVGPAMIQLLLAKSVNVDFYQLTIGDFVRIFGITVAQATKIQAGLQSLDVLENELALIDRHAICWVTVQDELYPALLRDIYLPPAVLYWQGYYPFEQKSLAVVGARAAGTYAEKIITRLVPSVVRCGWTIVSGGAYGADTMAHRSALEAKGKTIAVLGSGLLRPYPVENKQLFQRIREHGGAIVSSFPLETKPLAGNFPARNRIIAGLSRGCLVVQAAKKSGALITAYAALEQARDVYAVPGSVDDELSFGCHKLIQEGALLVHQEADLLYALGEAVPSLEKKEKVALESLVQVDRVQEGVSSTEPLSVPESIVAQCVHAISIDDLVSLLHLPLSEIQDYLFDLQLDGRVQQTVAGLWKSC